MLYLFNVLFVEVIQFIIYSGYYVFKLITFFFNLIFNINLGMVNLCAGLMESPELRVLNLAWNGIGSQETIAPLVKYIKDNSMLEELYLNNNRITGPPAKFLKGALLASPSLIKVYLGFNPLTPEEAQSMAEILTDASTNIEYIDLENCFVKKNFIAVINNNDKDKTI